MTRRLFLLLAKLRFDPNVFPDTFNAWAAIRNKGKGETIDIREFEMWAEVKRQWARFEKEHSRFYNGH
jgi:hypothetical protein